jgi:hypothetical protein
VRKSKLLPRYSGRYSHKFWEEINSLRDPQKMQAYELGCLLQNIEGDFLDRINRLIEEVKQK